MLEIIKQKFYKIIHFDMLQMSLLSVYIDQVYPACKFNSLLLISLNERLYFFNKSFLRGGLGKK